MRFLGGSVGDELDVVTLDVSGYGTITQLVVRTFALLAGFEVTGVATFDAAVNLNGATVVNGTIVFPTCHVSLLPTPVAALKGARGFVDDANLVLNLGIASIVTGGGSNYVPVYCTGTAWRVG